MVHKSREWLSSTWLGRLFAAVAAATTFLSVSTVLEAAPAHADTVTYQVYNTGGEGLWLHPGSPTLTSSLSDLMPDGTNFDISCWQNGDNVNGDAVWDYGTDEDTGDVGYASDYYINTPTTQGNEGSQLAAMSVPQCGSSPSSSSVTSLPCTPVLLIGARGSGESYARDNDNSGTSGFGSTLAPIADALYDYYGGSSQVTTYGLPYQAVSVTDPTTNVLDNVYVNSVGLGAAMLTNIINEQESACPNQLIDLAGYSQGAEVVADVASNLSSNQLTNISGIVLFGDPRFNPTNSEDQGSFNPNLSGIFGQRPEATNGTASITRSYCDSGDAICNYSLPNAAMLLSSGSPHYQYMNTHAPDAESFLESQDPTDFIGGIA